MFSILMLVDKSPITLRMSNQTGREETARTCGYDGYAE
jgi:hypothetical protein